MSGGDGTHAVLVVDIVEDQRLFRDLLGEGLAASSVFRVRFSFGSAEEALQAWQADAPDAVILDISLPGINGVNAGVQLKRRHPHVAVLLLSTHAVPGLLDRLPADVRDGWGYMLKGEVSLSSVHSTLEGLIAGTSVDTSAEASAAAGALDLFDLTARQRQVLRLLGEGMSNERIATELQVTRKSVENYINRIYAALGLGESDAEVSRRVLASLAAQRVWDIEVDP